MARKLERSASYRHNELGIRGDRYSRHISAGAEAANHRPSDYISDRDHQRQRDQLSSAFAQQEVTPLQDFRAWGDSGYRALPEPTSVNVNVNSRSGGAFNVTVNTLSPSRRVSPIRHLSPRGRLDKALHKSPQRRLDFPHHSLNSRSPRRRYDERDRRDYSPSRDGHRYTDST